MKRLIGFVGLFTVVALSPAGAPGCGPSVEAPGFTPARRPSVPLKQFYAGKLGVITGSFNSSYLVAAWRHLNAKPLSQAALKSLTSPAVPPPEPWFDASPTSAPAQEWIYRRSIAIEDPTPRSIHIYRKVPGADYQRYPNCLGHSFETAVVTLHQRMKKFKAEHVAAWVKAQDIVFANCSDGTGVPAGPEPSLPPLLAADRQYQIASAHFYAGRFDEARAVFLRIAKDDSSPWNDWAPYLAARCLIRKASLTPATLKQDLSQAEQELVAVVKSSRNAGVKESAKGLADHAVSKLRPGDALARIANELANPSRDSDFTGNLQDFDYLLKSRSAADSVHVRSELYDWIRAMKGMPADPARALKNDAFLLAALAHAKPDSLSTAPLLDAAARVNPSSAAYPSIAFHAYRLSAKNLTEPQRREQLDTALGNLRRTLPRSAWSPFLAERMPLAVSFAEFLQLAPRAPAASTWESLEDGDDWPAGHPQLLLDRDAIRVFHRYLPLSLWRKAAEDSHLSPHLRSIVLRAAWARAVVLGDESTVSDLRPNLIAAYPELKQFAGDADAFSAVYLLLHAPGIQPFLRFGLERSNWRNERLAVTAIDNYRRNFWCPSGPGSYAPAPEPNLPEIRLAFLTVAERTQVARELEQIESSGSGATFLTERTIEWVNSHQRDPRAPKALHLAVRAARYSCTDEETGTYTKRAFQMLHKLYPKSEWAKKTPYWYD